MREIRVTLQSMTLGAHSMRCQTPFSPSEVEWMIYDSLKSVPPISEGDKGHPVLITCTDVRGADRIVWTGAFPGSYTLKQTLIRLEKALLQCALA